MFRIVRRYSVFPHFLIFLTLLMSACTSYVQPDLQKGHNPLALQHESSVEKHLIVINKEGKLSDTHFQALKNPQEYIKALFEHYDALNSAKALPISVYIHGGLVGGDVAIEFAQKSYQLQLEDSVYPVYVVWESDLGSALSQMCAQPIGSSLLGSLEWVVGLPVDLYDLVATNSFSKTQNITLEPTASIHYHYNPSSHYHRNIGQYIVAFNPFKLISAMGTHHLARGVWRELVTIAHVLNAPTSDFSYFIEGLKGKHVHMIGHSMGTIVINDILKKYSDIAFERVVYIGAACSLSDIKEYVVPYLQRHSETQYYNISLHEGSESNENQGATFIEDGGMLEWLDDFIAPSNIPLEKRAGKWRNITQHTNIFDATITNQVHLTRFDAGCESQYGPQRHKSMYYYRYWLESYWENEAFSIVVK